MRTEYDCTKPQAATNFTNHPDGFRVISCTEGASCNVFSCWRSLFVFPSWNSCLLILCGVDVFRYRPFNFPLTPFPFPSTPFNSTCESWVIYIVNVFFFFGRFAQNYQKIDSKNFQTFIFLFKFRKLNLFGIEGKLKGSYRYAWKDAIKWEQRSNLFELCRAWASSAKPTSLKGQMLCWCFQILSF